MSRIPSSRIFRVILALDISPQSSKRMCLNKILIISRLAESVLRDWYDLIHSSILHLPTDQCVCNKRAPIVLGAFCLLLKKAIYFFFLSSRNLSINLYPEMALIKLSENYL